MKTLIALLRGVNVGGNKRLSMAELRAFIEALGFTRVQTLLQSGNLVFRSDGLRDDSALEFILETEAAKRLGLQTTFILRTPSDWAEVIDRNPFPEAAAKDPSHLLVMFFREPPPAEAVEFLHTTAVGVERIQPDGRQMYGVFPAGIADSKLANALMSPRVGRRASGRNWNTVVKLGALAGL